MELSALETTTEADRDEIISLFHRAVEHLNAAGIPQWDELYPDASDIEEDISKRQLYVTRENGRIAGVITLNKRCDPEYESGKWSYRGPEYTVVHRLCVSPDVQGHGVGTQIMGMAEEMLRSRGVKSMRLDTFSQNPWSLRMYEKLGYHTVGTALWRKGLFYLMEKNIG